MDVMTRVPVREQDPQVRAANFEEVCLGYNAEEATVGAVHSRAGFPMRSTKRIRNPVSRAAITC